MLDRRACVAILGGSLAASCHRDTRKVIAVIPKGTSHVFWVNVQQGALDAGKEFGVEVLWNGAPTETDYARQIQIVDSMVARRVDAIAVAPTERTALVTPVERAVAAGIPVTVFDSGLDSTNYMSFVATDNVEAGRLGARTLAKLIGGKGKVALIMHAPGSGSTMDRERGFSEVIEREYPNIQIVASQFGMSDRAKARAAAENILTAHADLNGMFASSEPSSVGAALAIKARGLSDQVKLVAFDSSETMIDDLRGGAIKAMVVQDPHKLGFEAVRTLVEKLNGKTPPKRIDLQARVLTTADLDSPDVKKLLQLK